MQRRARGHIAIAERVDSNAKCKWMPAFAGMTSVGWPGFARKRESPSAALMTSRVAHAFRRHSRESGMDAA